MTRIYRVFQENKKINQTNTTCNLIVSYDPPCFGCVQPPTQTVRYSLQYVVTSVISVVA
jgi:hypothetical protein